MSTPETSDVLVDRSQSGVVTVTLDRPPVNAITPNVIEDLLDVIDDIADDPQARAVLFTGANGRWCGGADLKVMSDHTRSTYRKMRRQVEVEDALERLEKPVVVAIEGFALGGGCELALACDVRIMADDATMGLPEVSLGLFPGAGGTQRLTRLVGIQKAFWIMANSMRMTAAEALDYGLVNEVVPAAQTQQRAREIAETFAQGATRAIGMTKRLVYESVGRELSAGLLDEGDSVFELLKTDDLREGFASMREKRAPKFTGA